MIKPEFQGFLIMLHYLGNLCKWVFNLKTSDKPLMYKNLMYMKWTMLTLPLNGIKKKSIVPSTKDKKIYICLCFILLRKKKENQN